MFSLINIQKFFVRHRKLLLLGAIILALLGSFGSLIHNHTDDYFHTSEHKDCPANFWAHAPFVFVLFVFLLFTRAIKTGTVFTYTAPFFSQEISFCRLGRAPPQ